MSVTCETSGCPLRATGNYSSPLSIHDSAKVFADEFAVSSQSTKHEVTLGGPSRRELHRKYEFLQFEMAVNLNLHYLKLRLNGLRYK